MRNKIQDIELPVYKSSYLLLLYSFKLIKNLTREYKYTIGEKLKNEMMNLLMNVYIANKTKKVLVKLEKIESAVLNIEVIKLLFRLLFDLHEINIKEHVKVSVDIENVRRQLIGWEKVLKR